MRSLVVLTLVGLFMFPESSFAQRGGRGGWGGGRGGNGWNGNNNGWNGNNNGWNGGAGWNSQGGFYGGFGYGNRGYSPFQSYGWGGYGNRGYYSPGYSGYVVEDSIPRTSTYYDPTTPSMGNDTANRVVLNIDVGDANSELMIEGQKMTLTGTHRVFISPELEQGRKYVYTITVKGNGINETRKLDVQAGNNLNVDFTKPQVQPVPSPATR